jgi:hypothetical protein
MVKHNDHHRHRLPFEHECPVVLFMWLGLATGAACFWLGWGAGRGFYPDGTPLVVSLVGIVGCLLAIMLWLGLKK